MTGCCVLLASPLLGGAAWEPVAADLANRGLRAVIAAASGPVTTGADVLRGYLRDVPDEPGLTLIPHSNAGLFVAPLARERAVARVVYVDALLPDDGQVSALADDDFRAFLADRVDADGLLPPWTSWWPAVDVAGLFPDARTRARVEAELPRLPLSYFSSTVPSPSGWRDLPSAYLGFGATYDREQERAAALGWPVEVLTGEHLKILVDPSAVCDAVLRLAGLARREG